MSALSWILDGVCSCLDGGCQISMDKKQWLLEAGLPQASLLLSNNACTYLDAISTIMAIIYCLVKFERKIPVCNIWVGV